MNLSRRKFFGVALGGLLGSLLPNWEVFKPASEKRWKRDEAIEYCEGLILEGAMAGWDIEVTADDEGFIYTYTPPPLDYRFYTIDKGDWSVRVGEESNDVIKITHVSTTQL